MRTRQAIEKESQWYASKVQVEVARQKLILEVLLDIRDILNESRNAEEVGFKPPTVDEWHA